MTREEKIKKKQLRSLRRKNIKIQKEKIYYYNSEKHDRLSISFGRKLQHGSQYTCSMGWESCEKRGYCNGDC